MEVGHYLQRLNSDTASIHDVIELLHTCNNISIPQLSLNVRKACCDFIMRKYIAYIKSNNLGYEDTRSIYNQCAFILKNSKQFHKYGISDSKRLLFEKIIGKGTT